MLQNIFFRLCFIILIVTTCSSAQGIDISSFIKQLGDTNIVEKFHDLLNNLIKVIESIQNLLFCGANNFPMLPIGANYVRGFLSNILNFLRNFINNIEGFPDNEGNLVNGGFGGNATISVG